MAADSVKVLCSTSRSSQAHQHLQLRSTMDEGSLDTLPNLELQDTSLVLSHSHSSQGDQLPETFMSSFKRMKN